MSKHPTTVFYKAALLSTVLSLLGFTIALADSGDLDPTFSGDGLVTTNVDPSHPDRGDAVEDLALQPDGKIVAVGESLTSSNSGLPWDFAVARYNPNGSLDTAFSGDGRRIVQVGLRGTARAVAVQPDGKILVVGDVAGAGGFDVAIVRLNPNGSLDPTFSGDGKQITDFRGENNRADAVALQSDGKILVTGDGWGGQTSDFVVYRYLSNGDLDPAFSGDGMINFGFGPARWDDAADLALQSDGKIVVAGRSGRLVPIAPGIRKLVGDFGIARLNPNGTLDTTFSGDGRQVMNLGSDELVTGLALQPDGKPVVVGRKLTSQDPVFMYFAVARFNTDGTPDLTFNGTGKKIFSIIPGQSSVAYDVVVSPGGKIIVAGGTDNGLGSDFAAARLTRNGSLDRTFSADGKVTIGVRRSDQAFAILLQPADGKYVLGGYACGSARPCDFALARVLP